MDAIMTIGDVQRHLKDRIMPIIDMGHSVVIEDAKSHKPKFKICPVDSEETFVEWPDFEARDRRIKSQGDITKALDVERDGY